MTSGAPQRIVSLVPSTTETVCAFGRGAALVGCTRYCVEPHGALATIPRIGGTKNPRREAILALEPDLVLANAEENRTEDLEWLGARVPVVVQTPCSVAEALACLRALAILLDAGEAARRLLSRIESSIARAAADLRPPLRVFLPIWRKPWMSVSAATFAHDVLRCAGATNVCAGLAARYPEVTAEWVRKQHPDAVLLPSEPWEFSPAECLELAGSRVLGDGPVVLCNGRDFCWHGVHVARGLDGARTVVDGVRASVPSRPGGAWSGR